MMPKAPPAEYPARQQPSLRTIAMPANANPLGDIFGGWILAQMDIAGAVYASHIVYGRLVTVAVESMKFHLPVYVGDEVSCFCHTDGIGTTSISVHVATWVRRRMAGREQLQVTEAKFIYVLVDDQRRPIPIKPHLAEDADLQSPRPSAD